VREILLIASNLFRRNYLQHSRNLNEKEIFEILPENKTEWAFSGATFKDKDYSGYEGFFSNESEVEKFLNGLQNVVRH
jgi:hypothetical protein